MARIFLSYSHLDDAAPPAPGWIRDFHKRLTEQLAIATGTEHLIWLDSANHRKNNQLGAILRDVAQASFLVMVLGPPHANSQWCLEELRTFLGRNPAYPRVATTPTRDLSHVFAVSKFPLSNKEYPLPFVLAQILPSGDPLLQALEQNLPYVFHEQGPPPRTFNPERPQDYDYHIELNKLAWNLAQSLANKVKVALLGGAESELLASVRRGVKDFGHRPLNGQWPAAIGLRDTAIQAAFSECELAVVALEKGSPVECWEWLEQATQHDNVRKCLVWLNDSGSGLDPARFAALRAKPANCELYEARSFQPAHFVQAVRDHLEHLERNPRLSTPPPQPDGSPRKRRVHVVYRSEDQTLANQVFQDAQSSNVPFVDVRVSSLDALIEHAQSAEAILIASSSEDAAVPLMKRVATRLNTQARGAVGFLAQSPRLAGEFRWLGSQVPGVFAQFPT